MKMLLVFIDINLVSGMDLGHAYVYAYVFHWIKARTRPLSLNLMRKQG